MFFEDSEKIFSQRIKELRLSHSMTQLELAQQLGFTKAAISNLENRKKRPSLETLLLFADYFTVSLDYLIGRSDEHACL